MCDAPIREYGSRYTETVLHAVLAYIILFFPLLMLAQAVGIVEVFGPPQYHWSAFENWVAFTITLFFAIPAFYLMRRQGRQRGALLQVYHDKVVYMEWRGKPKTLLITRRTHVEGNTLVIPSEDGSACQSIVLYMLPYKSEVDELTALMEELSSQMA